MSNFKMASINFEKFHSWLSEKYPPKSMFEKIYAEQIDDHTLKVYYCYQYGAIKQTTNICNLKMYPMFDCDFDPNIFYSNENLQPV